MEVLSLLIGSAYPWKQRPQRPAADTPQGENLAVCASAQRPSWVEPFSVRSVWWKNNCWWSSLLHICHICNQIFLAVTFLTLLLPFSHRHRNHHHHHHHHHRYCYCCGYCYCYYFDILYWWGWLWYQRRGESYRVSAKAWVITKKNAMSFRPWSSGCRKPLVDDWFVDYTTLYITWGSQ